VEKSVAGPWRGRRSFRESAGRGELSGQTSRAGGWSGRCGATSRGSLLLAYASGCASLVAPGASCRVWSCVRASEEGRRSEGRIKAYDDDDGRVEGQRAAPKGGAAQQLLPSPSAKPRHGTPPGWGSAPPGCTGRLGDRQARPCALAGRWTRTSQIEAQSSVRASCSPADEQACVDES
jgi:hypothetical protein